jgi:hypothetical protein
MKSPKLVGAVLGAAACMPTAGALRPDPPPTLPAATWVRFEGVTAERGDLVELTDHENAAILLRSADVRRTDGAVEIRVGALAERDVKVVASAAARPLAPPPPPPPPHHLGGTRTAAMDYAPPDRTLTSPPASAVATDTWSVVPTVPPCGQSGACSCAACIGFVSMCCASREIVGACVGLSSCP